MDRRVLSWAVLGVGVGLTLIVYAQSLSAGFVYEDWTDSALYTSPHWARLSLAGGRSLPALLVAVGAWVGSGEAWPFHLMSLSLFLVNGLLLFLILGGLSGAFATSWYWLHPLNVESVAYVSSLPDLLLVTCLLVGTWAALRGYVAAAFCCVVLACLAKETGAIVWALIPVIVGLRDGPRWKDGHWTAEQWAFWVLVGLGPIAIVAGSQAWVTPEQSGFPALSLTHTLTSLAVVCRYVGWTLVPFGVGLLHDWSWATPTVGIGCAILLGYLALYVRVMRGPLLFLAVALLPRLLVPLGDGLHDHHWGIVLAGFPLICGDRRAWCFTRTQSF